MNDLVIQPPPAWAVGSIIPLTIGVQRIEAVIESTESVPDTYRGKAYLRVRLVVDVPTETLALAPVPR